MIGQSKGAETSPEGLQMVCRGLEIVSKRGPPPDMESAASTVLVAHDVHPAA